MLRGIGRKYENKFITHQLEGNPNQIISTRKKGDVSQKPSGDRRNRFRLREDRIQHLVKEEIWRAFIVITAKKHKKDKKGLSRGGGSMTPQNL